MAKGAYIGIDNVARKIKKGYIGVDGIARKIKKAYIGDENGIARLFWQDGIDISAATATPADVLPGYTFYAGSEELQTGTSTALRIKTGTATFQASNVGITINCGFAAKHVIIGAYATPGTSTQYVMAVAVNSSNLDYVLGDLVYKTITGYGHADIHSKSMVKLTDTGFQFKSLSGGAYLAGVTIRYVAVG